MRELHTSSVVILKISLYFENFYKIAQNIFNFLPHFILETVLFASFESQETQT